MRLGRICQRGLVFRNMRATCYVVDRQIDEAVGLRRCISYGVLDVRESFRVIRMAESFMNFA